MNSIQVVDWLAKTVNSAVTKSGRSVAAISEDSCIPRPTLIRKLRGHGSFGFPELLELAEATNTPPWQFTPPAFTPPADFQPDQETAA